jgi:hypothetical protein
VKAGFNARHELELNQGEICNKQGGCYANTVNPVVCPFPGHDVVLQHHEPAKYAQYCSEAKGSDRDDE